MQSGQANVMSREARAGSPALRRAGALAARAVLRGGAGLAPSFQLDGPLSEWESAVEAERMAGSTGRRPSFLGRVFGRWLPAMGAAGKIALDVATGNFTEAPRDFNTLVRIVRTASGRDSGAGSGAGPGAPQPAAAGPPPSRRRRARQQESEQEWNPARQARALALMQRLGARAAVTANEAEAEDFVAAMAPLAAALRPSLAPFLLRSSPQMARGLVGAMHTLRRRPATRPLIRRFPAIVRGAVDSLARRAAQGQRLTPGVAVRTLARQTARGLGGLASGSGGGSSPPVSPRIRRICLEASRRATRIRELRKQSGADPQQIASAADRSQAPIVDEIIGRLSQLPSREVDLVVGCMARIEHAAGVTLPSIERLRSAASPYLRGLRES